MAHEIKSKINYQFVPSVPGKIGSYGYTEQESTKRNLDRALELNKPTVKIHSGLAYDQVGPGQYS